MNLKAFWTITVMLLAVVGAVAGELDQLPLGDPQRAYLVGIARAGQLYDCRAGTVVAEDAVVDELAGGRVILLGEEHTRLDQKGLQARLLARLADRLPHLLLGMEFFQRGDDEVLTEWNTGKLDGDEFLLASQWYDRGGYNWSYYAPVMEAARKHGVPVVGLNVPREIPRTVSRKGFAGLTPEQSAEVGPVDTGGSPQHHYLIRRYFGDTVGMVPSAWLARMYAAQCVWDVVMARSILDKLPSNGTMVVVVGSGHVAYGLGIARRIHEELASRGQPDIPVTTLCPATAPAPQPEGENPHGHPMPGSHPGGAAAGPPALFSRSLADVVAVFPDHGGVEAVPRIGLKLEEAKDGIVVKRAWPDTASAAAGLKKGDRVLDLNGVVPSDIHRLRLALARLRWGDRFDMRVERDGKEIDCTDLLEPEIESTETTLAPGWKVEPVKGFAPAAPTAVKSAGKPAWAAENRLVLHDGNAVRVETWEGETLAAVHDLDSDGRVTRSLYRDRREDGAVQIRYERGADGAVISTTRLDRAGKPVGT